MAFDLTCLTTVQAKQQRLPLLVRGLALGHHLAAVALEPVQVPLLGEQPAHHPAQVEAADLVDAGGVHVHHAQVLLLRQHLRAPRPSKPGAITASTKCSVSLARRGRVDPLVEGDDPAEGRGRVAGPGPLVGLERALAQPGAAGVGVLDDHAGRLVDLGGQAPGGVEVEDVVERELLALQLAGRGHRVERRAEVAVEGRALVRVLAVAQVLHLLEGRGSAGRGRSRRSRPGT